MAVEPGSEPAPEAPGDGRRDGAIKLRYHDFTTLTRQMRLSVQTDEEREIYRAALVLLRRVWQRGRPVRLLGVAARELSPPTGQLSLWKESQP